MSKTLVYTLIATALLGVLLILILRLASDMQTRVEAEADPAPAADFIRDTGLPRVATRDELLAFMAGRGVDAENAVRAATLWRHGHGFLGRYELFGVTEESSPMRAYDDLDDEELASRSEQDDAGATRALAARVATVDPVAAMGLYETAAAQGSIYAMLRIGSLRETIADMVRNEIGANPAFVAKLGELEAGAPGQTMDMAAFAYVAAAVRDGGIAVVDNDLLAWITRMAERFAPAREAAACAYSDQLFVRLSVARRARGLPPITTEPPPVFVAVPGLHDRLPCRATSHPILRLLDLSACSAHAVENARAEPVDLYICRN